MKVAKLDGGSIEVQLTLREYRIIKNCLNEVCNGFKVPDFEARIGAKKDVVRHMLEQIVSFLS